jgi:cell division septal protein FtsQ
MVVETVKKVTAGAIWLIGVILTGAVFIRFTYETATEAKARVIKVEEQMTNVADKVADRMIIINNQNMHHLDLKLDRIYDRLQKIERKVGD